MLNANIIEDTEAESDDESDSSPYSETTRFVVPEVTTENKDEDYKKAAKTILEHLRNETLSHRLSAPYEMEQYPIEVNERKSKIGQHILESVTRLQAETRKGQEALKLKEIDVPSTSEGDKNTVQHFQQVLVKRKDIKTDYDKSTKVNLREPPGFHSTVGIFNTLIPLEEMPQASIMLVQALELREKYMTLSNQSFPTLTARFLKSREADLVEEATADKMNKNEAPATCQLFTIKHPWKVRIPKGLGYHFWIENGIVQCYKNKKDIDAGKRLPYSFVSLLEFILDLDIMNDMIANGPLKSFCYRRLSFLLSKYQLHVLLNEHAEISAQKVVPHRDFYNVRKVDTHVHAASSMNQKHLLGFIKKTLKNNGDDVVSENEGRKITLKEVFQSLNIVPYDLNVDMLDVHADRTTSYRYDKFNAKYNPIGQSDLRKIFLTTDNYIQGRYFASLLKEVISDLEESKYQSAEIRLTIFGKKIEEWDNLAKWAVKYDMYSDNVRWLIEVPRLYNVYRSHGLVENFQDMLRNIFLPLFEATNNPQSHKELFLFLQYVVGFDSVDDESKPENPKFEKDTPLPQNWTDIENPTYNYYMYYMYANISVLNHFRKERGFNTFTLRPNCGETGLVHHLLGGFLLCEGISHGLLLRKVPVLQYLYFLAQIPIAMSPLSNNLLFMNYHRNPLPDYFNKGLFISLSTNDPLQFHFTREPLMEEYSIAAQLWKFSSTDMCELAHNSVLMSGFPHSVKTHWLGPNYRKEGVQGNDITRTNLPNICVAYRYKTLLEEHSMIFQSKKRK